MTDLPYKLFPPALLAGVALYGLVCMLWLQPLVEGRMAEKALIPQCEEFLREARETASGPRDQKRRELETLIALYDRMGLSQVPYVQDMIEVMRQRSGAGRADDFRVSGIEGRSLCACAVDKAFAEAHLAMTLHVASLRTHAPAAVRTLDRTVIAALQSGLCGPLPWRKG